MGALKQARTPNGECPTCGAIPEKVYGQWWPHEPGACRDLRWKD